MTTHPAAPQAVPDEDEPMMLVLVRADAVETAYARGWLDGAFGTFVGALLLAILVFGMRGPW
jgi:hypothetical protein